MMRDSGIPCERRFAGSRTPERGRGLRAKGRVRPVWSRLVDDNYIHNPEMLERVFVDFDA